MKREISKIQFGELQAEFELDVNNVIAIVEHQAQGDGDKWYYDVIFEGDESQRIFNVTRVWFKVKI